MIPDLVLSPDHRDLHRLADTLAGALRTADYSKGSESKRLLDTPNDFAWDVKRKLVWLGTKSYLFRFFFANYLDEHEADDADIGITDDFICQECTPWSGLGVIDILAYVLDISD